MLLFLWGVHAVRVVENKRIRLVTRALQVKWRYPFRMIRIDRKIVFHAVISICSAYIIFNSRPKLQAAGQVPFQLLVAWGRTICECPSYNPPPCPFLFSLKSLRVFPFKLHFGIIELKQLLFQDRCSCRFSERSIQMLQIWLCFSGNTLSTSPSICWPL